MTLMHRLLWFLFGLLCLVILPAAVTAQDIALNDAAQKPKGTAQKEAAQKSLEQKALTLLDQVSAQTGSLKLPENRIHVQAKVVSVLWPRDEKRARTLFGEAMSGLGALINGLDPNDPQYPQALQTCSQLRTELMQTASQRDPKLALDFLRATRLPARQQGYGQLDPETQMELNLASMLAAKDPKIALQLAEESLTKGASSQAIGILSQLINKDREAATTLANDILKKLRTSNLLASYETMNAALGLLNIERRSQAGDRSANSSSNKPELVITDAMLREVIELMMAAVMSVSANGAQNSPEFNNARNALNTLQAYKALVEKYAPSRVAALQQKTAEFESTLDAHSKAWREIQNLSQKGTIDDMLTAVAKMPPETQPDMYRQTAAKAFGEGNTALAQQIITEHVSDPAQRAWMLADLDRQAFWHAVNEGKLDEARQYAKRLRSVEECVQMMTQLAMNMVNRGDKKQAVQLLNEARAMLGQRPENQMQMNAWLQLAGTYATLEPTRGFEMLESLADQLNNIIAAAAVLDGFHQNGGFREGEMLLSQGSFATSLVSQYAEKLSSLVRADFDRAQAATDHLQLEEARLLIKLAVAQGALAPQATTNEVDVNLTVHERGQQTIEIRGRNYIIR